MTWILELPLNILTVNMTKLCSTIHYQFLNLHSTLRCRNYESNNQAENTVLDITYFPLQFIMGFYSLIRDFSQMPTHSMHIYSIPSSLLPQPGSVQFSSMQLNWTDLALISISPTRPAGRPPARNSSKFCKG